MTMKTELLHNDHTMFVDRAMEDQRCHRLTEVADAVVR